MIKFLASTGFMHYWQVDSVQLCRGKGISEFYILNKYTDWTLRISEETWFDILKLLEGYYPAK